MMLGFVTHAPISIRSPSRVGLRWVCAAAPSRKAVPHVQLTQRHPVHHALSAAPGEPGVYRFLDASEKTLYIGKARHLRNRLRNYLVSAPQIAAGIVPAKTVSPRIGAMLARATHLDFILTKTESAALALEASMIAETRPEYNVLLKDDRRHPYAMITFSEEYPRIVVTRARKKLNQEDRLYGPFVDEGALRRLLAVIHATFPLRQRARPLFSDRPCINYDLKRCPGVCQKLITSQRYTETVENVDKLLSGRVEEVLDAFRYEMKALSSKMLYEEAALVRDRIASIQAVFSNSSPSRSRHAEGLMLEAQQAANIVSQNEFASRDVFAIASGANVRKVALFQVRGGKVISRLVFTTDSDAEEAEALSAVLSAHYGAAKHAMEIPEEIVLSTQIPDVDVLRGMLCEKRGKAVNVRGARGLRDLIDIVKQNADFEVRMEQERQRGVVEGTKVLVEMLRPYFKSFESHGKASLAVQSDATSNRERESANAALRLRRIECFDISHTSGSNAVGSMAVFVDGAPAMNEYRRYNLAEASSSQGRPDDFESIRETLRRRFRDFDELSLKNPSSRPDLVVIDGGKGQLSSAIDVFQELGLQHSVPLISIAKGQEGLFVEQSDKPINYDEETNSCAMNDGVRLICRIRDAAHDTAIRAHRRRRGKQALRSGLDSVPGLGTMKRAALLAHFNGSSEAIAQAARKELILANGIGPALANRIYEHFHEHREGEEMSSV